MPQEIERKFRLRHDGWRATAGPGIRIQQGYLSTVPERTVRVRRKGDIAYLTVKGKTEGIQRLELEYPIPIADAKTLLALCPPPLIEKTRYEVPHGSHLWEIDVFEGANAGLAIAEVELSHPDEPVQLPDWIGKEVSHDVRYYNANLIAQPYGEWGGDT